MARKKFSDDQIAQILVDAAYHGDQAAAQSHDITERVLRKWRTRLNVDVQLEELFHKKRHVMEQNWASDLPAAITAAITAAKTSALSLDPRDPDSAHAIAGILKILSDIATTQEVLNARLSGPSRQTPAQD